MSHLVMPLDVVEPVEKIKPQGPDQILYSFEWVVFEVFAGKRGSPFRERLSSRPFAKRLGRASAAFLLAGDLEHMDLILAGNMPARVEAAKQIIL